MKVHDDKQLRRCICYPLRLLSVFQSNISAIVDNSLPAWAEAAFAREIIRNIIEYEPPKWQTCTDPKHQWVGIHRSKTLQSTASVLRDNNARICNTLWPASPPPVVMVFIVDGGELFQMTTRCAGRVGRDSARDHNHMSKRINFHRLLVRKAPLPHFPHITTPPPLTWTACGHISTHSLRWIYQCERGTHEHTQRRGSE